MIELENVISINKSSDYLNFNLIILEYLKERYPNLYTSLMIKLKTP